MALINRNSDTHKQSLDRPNVEKKMNVERVTNEAVQKEMVRKYSSKERDNLKVNPPTLRKLKLIAQFEGGKLYENVDKIIDFYLENKFEDRDKRILNRMIEKREEENR